MKKIKKIMMWVVVIGALLGCVKALDIQEAREYDKAMSRCNGQVVEWFNEQGDTFYACK